MAKEHAAAIITIKDAAKMTARGRRDIARWLRRHASFLERHASEFSARFTARYLYR